MKAASTPSSIPFSENEAASGTVPYMQSGEATPIALAANIEKRPRDMRVKSALSRSFANTETTEPDDSRRPEGRDVAEHDPEMAAEIYEFFFHASLSLRAMPRRLLYISLSAVEVKR